MSHVINESFKLDCPVPIPVWIVIVSIVGSIVGIGLIILVGIKIIIIIIQRRALRFVMGYKDPLQLTFLI